MWQSLSSQLLDEHDMSGYLIFFGAMGVCFQPPPLPPRLHCLGQLHFHGAIFEGLLARAAQEGHEAVLTKALQEAGTQLCPAYTDGKTGGHLTPAK